jgi:mono/diheme cytochrome c family protein
MTTLRSMVLVALPLFTAALWMDDQPVAKPYRSKVLPPAVGSVPFTGTEAAPSSDLANPVPATPASLAQGKGLFTINCAMCHGASSAQPGPVGLKLKPPPPTLDPARVQARSDAAIFSALTRGFGRMPPFRDKLTVFERWHLVNYLRSRQ